MNFSAILAPTVYVKHEEVCLYALVQLHHKQFIDLI